MAKVPGPCPDASSSNAYEIIRRAVRWQRNNPKHNMKLIFCLLFVSVITMYSSFGQTNILESFYDQPPKNALYITFGLMPGFKTILGHYERIIFQNPTSFFKSVGIKVGMGLVSEWEDYKNGVGTTSSAYIFTILGKKATHLDFTTGLFYTFPESLKEFGSDKPETLYPAFTLSYRYQKPLGYFVLRTGIGFPFELIHLSIGFSF